MGRKPVMEKKRRVHKKHRKVVKPLVMKPSVLTSQEVPTKKKSRYSRKFSVTARIDMDAVTSDDNVTPRDKDGDVVLDVECGPNKALLFLSKLSQGSKGQCISFQGSWLTPNQFQYVSGRETAKDWKRSIRHNGKSIKLLMAKGILTVTEESTSCQKDEDTDDKDPSSPAARLGRRLSTLENLDSSRDGMDESLSTSDVINTDITNSDDKENYSGKEKNIVKSPEATKDLKEENNGKDVGSENEGEKWEGASDTTEPVDYNSETLLERCEIENECGNIINECENTKIDDTKLDEKVLKTTEINKSRPKKKLKRASVKKRKKEESMIANANCTTEYNVQTDKISDDSQGQATQEVDGAIVKGDFVEGTSNQEKTLITKKRKLTDLHNGKVASIPKGKKRKRRKKLKNVLAEQKVVEENSIMEEPEGVTMETHGNDDKTVSELEAASLESSVDDVSEKKDGLEENPKVENDELSNAEINEETCETTELSTDNEQVADKNVCGTRESRLGSIIDQLRENKEKNVGHKINKVLDKLSQGTPTDIEEQDDNAERTQVVNNSDEIDTGESDSTDTKIALSVREKSPRKHNHAKRSPYHMKKEANQKYLEIFESSSDSPTNQEDDSANVEKSDRLSEETVKTEISSESKEVHVYKKYDTQNVKADTIEKTSETPEDENRNKLKDKECTKIDSVSVDNKAKELESKKERHFSPISFIPYSSSIVSPPSFSAPVVSPKTSSDAFHNEKPKVKESHIPSVKFQHVSTPNDMPIFRGSPCSSSPSRTCSPLSRKERILQSAGGLRSNNSPMANHADNYNECMRVLAATYGHHNLIPSPAIFDPFFPFRNPDIPIHPGFIHPFMFPGFIGHKQQLPSMSLPHEMGTWTKYSTPTKTEGSSVLDLSRSLPLTSPTIMPTKSTSHTSSKNQGIKRSSTEADIVLDLSVKRSRLEAAEISKIHTNKHRHSLDSHIRNKSHSKSSANTHVGVNPRHKHGEKYFPSNAKLMNKSWTTYSDSGKTDKNKCQCELNNAKDIRNWSVERVCQFLCTLDGCASYVKVFLDHRITGKFLPHLTTEQLVRNLGMKIGPAMILCEAVTKKVLEMRKYATPCDFCKTRQSTKITI